MDISDISDGGEGILTLTSPDKTFRINRRSLGFTWSCPSDLDSNPISGISAVSAVLEKFGPSKWVIAEEPHKSGKLHYHAEITYDKSVDIKNPRAFDVAGVHPNIIKPHKGGKWKAYCMKGQTYKANHKVRRPMKLITPDLWWEQEILEIISEEPDDRTLHWYWSDQGKVGKTQFCKYLSATTGAIPLNGKGADVRNGILTYFKETKDYPEIVLVNIPRSVERRYISMEALENVKDMYFYSGKFEGGHVNGPNPHIFVFANQEPDKAKMSPDRWIVTNIDPSECTTVRERGVGAAPLTRSDSMECLSGDIST